MKTALREEDIKIFDERFQQCFTEYIDSLAEWKVAYKEVLRESADKVAKHQFDFKLLAKESFLHHMKNYSDKESALFEAEEILRKAEKYKPNNPKKI